MVGARALEAASLRRAVEAALEAVDPEAAVHRWLESNGPAGAEAVHVVAAGKAAVAMVRAAHAFFGPSVIECVAITDHAESAPSNCEVIVAGHPLPDKRSMHAAERAISIVESAGDRALVLFLISGGGSALMERPAAELQLDELRDVTGLLLKSGMPIDQFNRVRPHLSDVKGGRLAARCRGRHITLALSDVVASPPHVIASGPTVRAASSPADAMAVLEEFGLDQQVPDSVLLHLAGAPDPPHVDGEFHIVGDGSTAANAARDAVAALGSRAEIHTVAMTGEAAETATLAYHAVAPGTVGVFAGETTVTVTGGGRGGRNQEAALSASLLMAGSGDRAIFFATDGVDGPTDAAGALVDGTTAAVIRNRGFDPTAALDANDSYPALDAAGALLRTGPTGTNVGDLWLISRE